MPDTSDGPPGVLKLAALKLAASMGTGSGAAAAKKKNLLTLIEPVQKW
jgi:hypothetical protein